MLHQQADAGDGNPAEKTKKDGFSAGTDQFDNIGVQTDGRHGHNDEEFGEFLEESENIFRYAESITAQNRCNDRCDHRRHNKPENEHREHFTKADINIFTGAVGFRFADLPKSKNQGNGDNRQRTRELHNGGILQYRAVGSVHRIPDRRCRRYGRSIIYRGARKETETFIGES